MDHDDQEEVSEKLADIQPRFFRTPSADLIRSPSGSIHRKSTDSTSNRRQSMDLSIRKRITKQATSKERASPPVSARERTSGLLEQDVELGEAIRVYEVAKTDELLRDIQPVDQEIVRFGGPYTIQDLKDDLHGLCTLKTLRRKLPITSWLPKYSRTDLVGDLLAGLTVGLTVVPQCLAYAQIADIKLEYGLNSAYVGCFLYALLGTSKDVTVGPTAILSLLTGAFIRRDNGNEGEWAVLLCFFVGCFQLLMGFLRLGFLINFISTPVVSGFTQAAVIVIILSQIKNMMGVSFGSAKDNVIQTLHGYWLKLPQTNGWDVLMGSICITLLLLMREMKMPAWKSRNGSELPPKWWRILKETIRLISVSRYAIVVVTGTALEFILEHFDIKVLSVTGKVDAGISPPKLPNFNVDGFSFGEVLSYFGSGLVMVPLLGTMESIAVAKTFAHKFRYNIDTTQEFLALGTANLVSSFFGSYPVTGAFTRSALNAESGVRTPLGNAVTGSFVVISILSLGPLFQYIPKSALAAVIICACLTMFDFQIFKELWYIRKSELFVLVLTMASCLFLRVEYGLIIGLMTSLLMLIYPMARPSVIVTYRHGDLHSATQRLDDFKVNVIPQGAIFFPAAEYLKEIFNDALFTTPVMARSGPRESGFNGHPLSARGDVTKIDEETKESLPPIVFDGIHLTSSDYSTLRALRSVYINCKANHRDIIFINTSDDILDLIIPSRKKTETRKTKRDPNSVPLNNTTTTT